MTTPTVDDGASQPPSTRAALERVRDALLRLKPAGQDGFEGLIVAALSTVTGLQFRLARSGLQSGRDAMSNPGPFAIAMEAKRYKDPLRTEDLAGKAVIAAESLADAIDLWILGATSEVGDDTALKLRDILELRGIALLVLDWTTGPIPRLATLLALARESVAPWLEENGTATVDDIGAALETIARGESFDLQATELHRALSAAHIGLDGLRRASAAWLGDAFGSVSRSRSSFGQIITIADPAAPTIARPALRREVAAALRSSDVDVVLVRGEEGTGKTWLVADVCRALAEAPIVLFASGRRVDRLDPADPIRGLATLIVEQTEGIEVGIEGWSRRLMRWKRDRGSNALRFVLVADGLNERSSAPWADTLTAFAPELRALGGRLLVTTRSEFWRRKVAPRLSPEVRTREVVAGGYTPTELRAVLSRFGVKPGDFSPRVQEFVCNPRVCAVAARMLRVLDFQPADLTVERLLFNYWRFRLEERGNLVGHDVRDFEKLLRSHARDWLQRPGTTFDRDDWLDHSGAARRGEHPNVLDDLTEIEEGRFLQVHDDDSYEFREEALPFALALVLTEELKKGAREPGVDLDDRIARDLDPIRGFDQLADILCAAVGLACADDAFPTSAREALVRAWLRLQNIGDSAVEAMSAYVRTNPALFLDIAESAEAQSNELRTEVLIGLLLVAADEPRVREEMDGRVSRWLGRWCRVADDGWIRDADAREKRSARRAERLERAFAEFTPTEEHTLGVYCEESAGPTTFPFLRLVARLLAGRRIAPFAADLFSWALAGTLGGDSPEGGDELLWVVRLNAVDCDEVAASLRAIVDPMLPKASETMRRAIATSLRRIGDCESAEIAYQLDPPQPSQSWQAVDRFCETDPFDPAAARGENLESATDTLRSLPHEHVFTSYSTTIDDHTLKELTPPLSRFEPGPLEVFLRQVVRSVASRTGMPLRQLAIHLPELSPLFGDTDQAAVLTAITQLIDEPGVVSADPDFVLGRMTQSLLPHLSAPQQLELLMRLGTSCPTYLSLGRALKPLTATALEEALERAPTAGEPGHMRWTLFFAAESTSPLTARSCEIVVDQASSPDERVAGTAAAVICDRNDNELNAAAVNVVRQWQAVDARSWHARAITTAVAQQERHDLLSLIAPIHLKYVADVAGGRALEIAMDATEEALSRLSEPIDASPPCMITVSAPPESPETGDWRSIEGIPSAGPARDEIADVVSSLNRSGESEIQRANEAQDRLHAAFREFESALASEGATELLDAPPRIALVRRMAEHNSSRVERWLRRILDTVDNASLPHVRNLGAALAGGYSHCDEELAASVLRRLAGVWSTTRVVVGPASVGILEQAIFTGPRGVSFDQLRAAALERATNDREIETLVSAAEQFGGADWLNDYVEGALQSSAPARRARALTAAGLRASNAQSDELFGREWGHGLASAAAASAAENYRRHDWACHWFDLARAATSGSDFWRYGQLATGVCDWRLVRAMGACGETELLSLYGAELHERLVTRAKKRSQERSRQLFGRRAPDRELHDLVVSRANGGE